MKDEYRNMTITKLLIQLCDYKYETIKMQRTE
jgi:hypothetical protein